jgi:uncharacterized delta-60 repeat protein
MKSQSTASLSPFLSPSRPARIESLESRRLLCGVGLDDSFGDGGGSAFSLEGDQYIYAVKVLDDGGAILAGRIDNGGDSDVLLVKLNPDGTLDDSFGNGGIVVQDLGTTADSANAMVIEQDGKILIAGQVDGDSYDFVAARFNDDGSLDGSFGDSGFVRVDFDKGFDIAAGIALTADGIVIAGKTLDDGKSVPAVATLSNSGEVLNQFVLNLGDDDVSVVCLAVKPDGTLVLGATATNMESYESDIAVITVNPDGSSPALTLIDIASNDAIGNIAVDTDGSCYVVGVSGGDFAVAKLAPDGSVDISFGTDGVTTIDFAGDNDQANAVVILPNSDILVVGSATIDGQSDFALARLTASGELNAEFGTDGLMTFDFGNSDESAMAVDINGLRIVVAGRTVAQDNDVAAMALTVEDSGEVDSIDVSITGVSNLVRGQEGAFAATSDMDGLTYCWDFGDGETGDGAEVKHVFTQEGQYTITVTVTDEYGNAGCSTFDITVDIIAIQTDAKGKTNLVAGGTQDNDIIYFRYNFDKKHKGLFAWINGERSGPFKITGHIIAFGQAGNDILAVKEPMPISAEFYGGDGNDLLIGSRKADTLIGGDGYDWIKPGWSKKDILEGEKVKTIKCFKGWHKQGWC